MTSTPGFRDAGFDNFGPAYEDWRDAETLLMCGTDPYESKTILFTDWIMPGIQNGQKAIFLLPRRTAGVAYAEKNGGLLIDIQPGTDLPVVLAIARVIVENGWEDGVDPELGQLQVGEFVGLRPGNPQHALAVAHHLGQVPDQGLRRLEGVAPGTGLRGAGKGRRDRPDRRAEDLHRRRMDGQAARGRQPAQDLDHDREGLLLVQQHRQHQRDLRARHHRAAPAGGPGR